MPSRPRQQRQAEALRLERRLADLVNQAYGLTSEEIDLLWRTAPRMPVGGRRCAKITDKRDITIEHERIIQSEQ